MGFLAVIPLDPNFLTPEGWMIVSASATTTPPSPSLGLLGDRACPLWLDERLWVMREVGWFSSRTCRQDVCWCWRGAHREPGRAGAREQGCRTRVVGRDCPGRWTLDGVSFGVGCGFLGERLVSLFFLVTKEDRDCLRMRLLLINCSRAQL